MLHIILSLYILSFAGGVTLIVVSFFAARQMTATGFRNFALVFLASTLIMLSEALKTYEKALASDFGPGFHVAAWVLSFAANGMMGWFLPLVALEVIRRDLSWARGVAHAFIALVLAVLGVMKEILSPTFLGNVNYAALLGLQAYGAIILLSGLGRIEHPWVISLIRSYLIYMCVFAPIAAAQLLLLNIPSSPRFFHEYPLVQLCYYVGLVVLVLFYIARYLLKPSSTPPFALSEAFVLRYHISKRESDIISMMVQGYSNRDIAEKLFISARTVKNHVYHIYQKTGAVNKIKLINMLNSPK